MMGRAGDFPLRLPGRRKRAGAVLLPLLLVAVLVGSLTPAPAGPPGGSGQASSSSSASPEEAAAALYGSTDLRLLPSTGAAYVEAFPAIEFYYVIGGQGLPGQTHIMAWEPATASAYDATRSFNSLLVLSGAVIATSAEALRYAKAYAEAANAELNLVREIVDQTDSARLDRTVPDPAATPVLGGFDASLETWTQENGVIADWTVRFRGNLVDTAVWLVQDSAVGPWALSEQAAPLRPGVRVTDSYPPSGHHVEAALETPGGDRPLRLPDGTGFGSCGDGTLPIASGENFDGSTWIVCYTRDLVEAGAVPPTDQQLADELLQAGLGAYAAQIDRSSSACASGANPGPNWGMVSGDADCTLQIVMDVDDLDCLKAGAANYGIRYDTRICFAPHYITLRRARGYNRTASEADVARTVIGHEHFHSIYVDAGAPLSLNFATEGLARFSETLLRPEMQAPEDSTWYGTQDAAVMPVGTNFFQLHPDLGMCEGITVDSSPPPTGSADPSISIKHSYDYGLYWGFLYWKDRNADISTIREFVSDLADANAQDPIGDDPVNDPEECDRRVAEMIGGVLVRNPAPPNTHAEALAEFGIHMWTKDFRWAPPNSQTVYDFGQYLLDVARDRHVSPTDPSPHQVGPWGLHFHALCETATTCAAQSFRLTYTTADQTAGHWRVRAIAVAGRTVKQVWELIPNQPQTVVPPAEADAIFVEAVRATPSAGSYTFTVEPL
ncbi:MAG: hypothetical protein HY775_05455 [Acidobacteria bacterium]|nr:hypothetical protein [Acidobacteriota bacterium]